MTTSTRVRAAVVALIAASALVYSGASSATASAAPGTVTGTVSYSGTGVANIQVSWLIPSSGDSNSVETQSDGTYSLTLPSGTSRYYIEVNADPDSSTRVDDTYLAEFFGAHNVEGYAFQTIAPHTSRASSSLDAVLEVGGSVSGTSPDLANQHINLVTDGQTDDVGPYADSSGNFAFTGYVPGTYELYAPAHGTFAPYLSAPFTLSNGQNLQIDPELPAGATVEGTITEPIDAIVTVSISGPGINDVESVETDASKHYSFTNLATGTFVLDVGGGNSPGDLYAEQQFTVHISSTGQSITHDFTMVRGGSITVTPTTTSTDPNVDYFVRLTDSAGALVAESGSGFGPAFTLYDVAPGTYTFGIVDDPGTGYFSQQVIVTAGQESELGQISLPNKQITISGKVAGGKSGTIGFSQSNASGTLHFESVTHFTSNGKYKAGSLLPGKYVVSVASDGREVVHYGITIVSSKSMNYSIGPKLVPIKGTVLLEGAKLQDTSLFYGTATFQEMQPYIGDGELTGSGHSGTYTFGSARYYGLQGNFQQDSPFYFSWPKSLTTIKLVVGHTTNLGTHTVTVLDGS